MFLLIKIHGSSNCANYTLHSSHRILLRINVVEVGGKVEELLSAQRDSGTGYKDKDLPAAEGLISHLHCDLTSS